MTWTAFVLLALFCSAVYVLWCAIETDQSPAFKRDMERVREMRKVRRAARRS
jgi:hypothetical protein